MQRTMSYCAPPKRSLFPTSPLPMEDEEEVEQTQKPIASDEATAADEPTTPKKATEANTAAEEATPTTNTAEANTAAEEEATPTTPKLTTNTAEAASFTTPEKPKKEATTTTDEEAAAAIAEEPKHKKHKKMLHVFHDIQYKYAPDVVKHCNTIKDALLGLRKIDGDMANDAADAGYHNSHTDYVASLFFEDIHNDTPKYAGAATYDQANTMINKVFSNATDVLITEAAEKSTTLFNTPTKADEANKA